MRVAGTRDPAEVARPRHGDDARQHSGFWVGTSIRDHQVYKHTKYFSQSLLVFCVEEILHIFSDVCGGLCVLPTLRALRAQAYGRRAHPRCLVEPLDLWFF